MKRFGVYLVLLCLIVAIQVIGAAQSFAEDILPAGTASDTKQLAAKKGTLHIGVLAFRGPDALRNRWQSLADYLGTIIPDYRFKLVPVSLVSAPELIETGAGSFMIRPKVFCSATSMTEPAPVSRPLHLHTGPLHADSLVLTACPKPLLL